MITPTILSFFTKEATAYHKKILKRVKKLVRQGKLDEAQQYIDDNKDFIRVTDQGSQIKTLGSGAEGVGTLVMGATDNPYKLTVRKAMDRDAPVFSKANMAQTHNVFRRATEKDNPLFAKRYSKKIRKGKKGTPYTINEFIRGDETALTSLPSGTTSGPGGIMLPEAGNKNVLTDIIGNPGNILTDETGAQKIIDFVPARRENMRNALLGLGPRAKQGRKKHGITLSPDQQLDTIADMQDPVKMQAFQQALMQDSDLIQKLSKPQLQREGMAGMLSDQWDVAVQPSDMGPLGLRRADRLRTLRGL